MNNKALNTKLETLNNFQNPNFKRFKLLSFDIGACLELSNSNLEFLLKGGANE